MIQIVYTDKPLSNILCRPTRSLQRRVAGAQTFHALHIQMEPDASQLDLIPPLHQHRSLPSLSTCTKTSIRFSRNNASALSLMSSMSAPLAAITWITPNTLRSSPSSNQNLGTAYPTTPRNPLIPARASRKSNSVSSGIVRRRVLAEDMTRGMAETKIKMAIRQDASGSKPDQPK